jgi:hypothetical protein
VARGVTAVSWKLIENGWAVHASDGEQVGVVFLVVGDSDADIFDGLAITQHGGFAFHNYVDRPHYIEAARVGEIDDAERVSLTIAAEQCRDLPLHDPPASARISSEEASLVDRAREEIKRLTGEDRTN